MSAADEFLSIDTPENVAFGYEVAGIGSRFLAALVDTVIILILQVVANGTLLLILSLLFRGEGDAVETLGLWLLAIVGLISFAFLWGYYIFFELLWNGQSPGKRWVGLRVIRTNGTPITLIESLIRNLVRLIDFLPAYYGLGVMVMFSNAQARRLGDLAAGTLVIRDKAAVTLESLANQSKVRHLGLGDPAAAAAAYPTERLTDLDVYMAEEYLRRRYDLVNGPELAPQIAQALFQRMGLPWPDLNSQDAQQRILDVLQARQSPSATATEGHLYR